MTARARSFETISGIGTLIISRTVPDLSEAPQCGVSTSNHPNCPNRSIRVISRIGYRAEPQVLEVWLPPDSLVRVVAAGQHPGHHNAAQVTVRDSRSAQASNRSAKFSSFHGFAPLGTGGQPRPKTLEPDLDLLGVVRAGRQCEPLLGAGGDS